MYSYFKLSFLYLKYLIKGGNLHSIHSPFVYNLTNQVIYNNSNYYFFSVIEELRKSLLANKDYINVLDLGAGSNFGNRNKKRICDIARNTSKSAKYGKLMFRLCNYFQPITVLELGTSLGVSTSYLSAFNLKSIVYTLEGCPEIANQASSNFVKLGLKNINQVIGDFSSTLDSTLQKIESLDFVFFDGNHKYEPTIKYFYACLPKLNSKSLLVFDDIHWSSEMEKAWNEIKENPKVTVTIDLFFIGLVFFVEGREKENYIIRY